MKRYQERPRYARIFLLCCLCILMGSLGAGGCELPAFDFPRAGNGAMPTSGPPINPAAAISARLVNRFEEKPGNHGPLQYGSAIGLDGDTLVVGASQRLAESGHQMGMVFVYQREADQWVEVSQITATLQDKTSQADIHFGSALALEGETLMIGAPGADDPAGGENSGAVFIFQRQANQWVQTGVLTASDAQAEANFGAQMALKDGVLLVSGGGTGQAVDVFERQGQRWVETTRLKGEGLGEKDRFGSSLAIGNDHLAIGSLTFDPQQDRYVSSAIYLFQRQGQHWNQETKLTFGDRGAISSGYSLDIEGDSLVAGVSADEAGYLSGMVNIYEYGPDGWQQQAHLVAGDGAFYSVFGSSVDLQGDILAVGSGGDSSHEYLAGSVTLFRRTEGAWIEALKLSPDENDLEGDFYGGMLKISGNTLVVAAPDEFGKAVYVYEMAN
jgi:FG-GAP repeat